MSIEVTLPELGENVEKGDVVRVLVAKGDVVVAEQAVIELETDKATIEVPTSAAGKISEIRVKAGDKVKVGQVMLVLENGAGAAAATPAAPSAKAPAAAVKSAEPAPADTPRTAARAASVVDITSARPASPPSTVEPPPSARPEAAKPHEKTAADASVPAAPSVRRYARELGLDIADVTGTGPGGRIGEEDVKAFVKARMTGGTERGMPAPALPDLAKWGPVEARPMSNIRRKTAEHLTTAWRAPHVTQHDKADVTALDDFRKTYGSRVEKSGGKLTVTAIAIKVVAAALGRYPQFASSVDMANSAIVFRKYCHVGVAVDTPAGLLVPVIRDADRKTISEIAAELSTLSQKARDKKLGLDDMSGSVFSITNLGGIGGTSFTPIVNYPEVAILGLSRASTEPVYRDGQFVPRQMLPLSLSYDHRAIDGADAARFLRFVAEGLEDGLTVML